MSVPLPPCDCGTASNLPSRFTPTHSEAPGDGWEQEVSPIQLTEIREEVAHTMISRSQSSDLPLDCSINLYHSCEYGCVYCYAWPSHACWDLSPGIDLRTWLIAKGNAVSVLERELSKPGYHHVPINLGANTDPYQPLEHECRLTRQVLEVLLRFRHLLTIVTKGSLILRDLDLLCELAEQNLVAVMISLATSDDELKRILELRVAASSARLWVIYTLSGNGIPVGVLCSSMIPMVNDMELERLLQAARDAGTCNAVYVLPCLSREVGPLLEEWLATRYPQRAEHVMSLVRQCRGGEVYDSRSGHRFRGQGPFADLLAQRFMVAMKRLGLDRREGLGLNCSRFVVPGMQMALFQRSSRGVAFCIGRSCGEACR